MLISVINRAQVTGYVAVRGRIEFNQSKAENGALIITTHLELFTIIVTCFRPMSYNCAGKNYHLDANDLTDGLEAFPLLTRGKNLGNR